MDPHDRNAQLHATIFERLGDLIEADPEATAVAMLTALLPILSRKYGAAQTPAAYAAIKANYRHATPEFARERALTEEGAHVALAALTQMAQVTVDYVPGSSAEDQSLADQKLSPKATSEISHQIKALRERALELGFSDFGALAMTLINSVALASMAGTNAFQIYRALLDCLNYITQQSVPAAPQMSEDEIAEILMARMGISKKTAMKYIQAAKELPPDWTY